MIISKFLLNKIVQALIEKFRIDKMFSYVFDDNELDNKVKNLEDRINILESVISSKVKRKYKKGEK
tara:strand:+ start:4861 stop:5058 length:198 start_codon:yes stop_codon:yes gene_type:complete